MCMQGFVWASQIEGSGHINWHFFFGEESKQDSCFLDGVQWVFVYVFIIVWKMGATSTG